MQNGGIVRRFYETKVGAWRPFLKRINWIEEHWKGGGQGCMSVVKRKWMNREKWRLLPWETYQREFPRGTGCQVVL